MSGKVAKKLAESLYVMYCTLLLGFICSFFSKHVDKGKHLNVLCGISDSSSLFNAMQVMHVLHVISSKHKSMLKKKKKQLGELKQRYNFYEVTYNTLKHFPSNICNMHVSRNSKVKRKSKLYN